MQSVKKVKQSDGTQSVLTDKLKVDKAFPQTDMQQKPMTSSISRVSTCSAGSRRRVRPEVSTEPNFFSKKFPPIPVRRGRWCVTTRIASAEFEPRSLCSLTEPEIASQPEVASPFRIRHRCWRGEDWRPTSCIIVFGFDYHLDGSSVSQNRNIVMILNNN